MGSEWQLLDITCVCKPIDSFNHCILSTSFIAHAHLKERRRQEEEVGFYGIHLTFMLCVQNWNKGETVIWGT